MDFSSGSLLCKAQYVVSSTYGILLWTSRLPFPMQTPKESPPHQYLQLGLNALINPGKKTHHNSCIIHSYMISSSPSSSSPSPSRPLSFDSMTHSLSWSSMMGDLIGSESGVYTTSNEDIITGGVSEKFEPYKCSGNKRNQRCEKKEYPPQVPLLARTGNFPGHMPWVLTRHYIDGKLILKEARVKRHVYFEAHRVNGRLILKLVPLDDTIECCHTACEMNEEDLHFIEEENESEEDVEAGEAVEEKSMAIVTYSMPKSCRENGTERNGEFPKCLTYAGTTISDSNLFGMPIAMNRAVRT